MPKEMQLTQNLAQELYQRNGKKGLLVESRC